MASPEVPAEADTWTKVAAIAAIVAAAPVVALAFKWAFSQVSAMLHDLARKRRYERALRQMLRLESAVKGKPRSEVLTIFREAAGRLESRIPNAYAVLPDFQGNSPKKWDASTVLAQIRKTGLIDSPQALSRIGDDDDFPPFNRLLPGHRAMGPDWLRLILFFRLVGVLSVKVKNDVEPS